MSASPCRAASPIRAEKISRGLSIRGRTVRRLLERKNPMPDDHGQGSNLLNDDGSASLATMFPDLLLVSAVMSRCSQPGPGRGSLPGQVAARVGKFRASSATTSRGQEHLPGLRGRTPLARSSTSWTPITGASIRCSRRATAPSRSCRSRARRARPRPSSASWRRSWMRTSPWKRPTSFRSCATRGNSHRPRPTRRPRCTRRVSRGACTGSTPRWSPPSWGCCQRS